MAKQLLTEWEHLTYSRDVIKESRDVNAGKLILQGVIQRSEMKNQNKRVYPHSILTREVENYQKAVREGRAVGELDHPESSTVSLKNASHVIREIWWNGQTVMGKVEILSTPSGKILERLLEDGIQIGISSRGVGSTEKSNEGFDIVQPDYQIICFDIVSDPSTPGAYLHEGKNYDYNKTFTKADRMFRALNDIVMKK
jgi:hypothetical protein